MATIEEMQAQAKVLAEQIEAAKRAKRNAERKAAQAKAAAEHAAHYAKMFEETGQPLAGLNEAQHGIVYAAAWELGHASGLGEVEMVYGDLAEMARKLLAAR